MGLTIHIMEVLKDEQFSQTGKLMNSDVGEQSNSLSMNEAKAVPFF